jgi:hypothetical protein
MTTYRLLWLDEKGNARKSTQIEGATDRQAVDIAGRQTGDYEAIEVWDGGRPVYRCENPKAKRGKIPTARPAMGLGLDHLVAEHGPTCRSLRCRGSSRQTTLGCQAERVHFPRLGWLSVRRPIAFCDQIDLDNALAAKEPYGHLRLHRSRTFRPTRDGKLR